MAGGRKGLLIAEMFASHQGKGRPPVRSPAVRRRAATTKPATPFVIAFFDDGGRVAVDRVAETFGMTKVQLAETMGLGRGALHKTVRTSSISAQSRLKEMLEILGLVSEWAGGKDHAMAWYRAQPIAALGGRTAEALVKSGQASVVRDYLDHLAMGGFA